MSKRVRKPAIVESDSENSLYFSEDDEVKPKKATKRKVAKKGSDDEDFTLLDDNKEKAPKKPRAKKGEGAAKKTSAKKEPREGEAPKKRGRPKKVETEGNAPVKRGRPKKDPTKDEPLPKKARVKKEIKEDSELEVKFEKIEGKSENVFANDNVDSNIKNEYQRDLQVFKNEFEHNATKSDFKGDKFNNIKYEFNDEDLKQNKFNNIKNEDYYNKDVYEGTSQEKKIDSLKKDDPSVHTDSFNTRWKDHEILQYEHNLDEGTARRLVNLFNENNTIPFIARYRKNETGNMTPDELRCVKETIDKVDALKTRMKSVVKILEKNGKLTNELRDSIMGAPNLEVLEHLYSPYKQGTPHSLVERAKALGLELPAHNLLEDKSPVNLTQLAIPDVQIEEIEKGVENIMAHIMATNIDTLSFLQSLKKETCFQIETKKAKKRVLKEGNEKPPPKSKGKPQKEVDESKFQNYVDYKNYLNRIKPHQILAINRGENLKVLSVKIIIPDFFKNKFTYFCKSKWLAERTTHYRSKLILEAIEDAYTRIIVPLVTREIRADLKSKAEKASLDVFSNNLKQILLAAPTKGRKILGIDPGFSNGCKVALISETGSVLETAVIYPQKNFARHDAERIITDIIINYRCTTIALGNGTACRETESWICDMISNNYFHPLEVSYTIVSECGASIYSCGKEAKKEFPDMDPNLISAVSLARRIQEPLAELVKVEPKHLGVGMYQHDLADKPLEEALNDVVSECVSFVGVDINTASQCLLKYVAGLTDKKASDIIKYREENGPFTSREELKKVKGIGPNTFQQCAGFIKVVNKTKTNKLDHTIIHPEAYDIAQKLIKKLNLNVNQIGEEYFITRIRQEEPNLINKFSELDTSKETLQLILEALSKPINHDLRDDIDNKPLFKKNLTTLEDLSVGTVLTGRVENVTHFGCFVDIGVKINGLIHVSQMKNRELKIGDRVEVNIANLELERKRIGLELLNVI